MKKIAIFGNGFLGSEMSKNLQGCTIITRENYGLYKNNEFDVFINCAGNSKTYLAQESPNVEYNNSIKLVYDTLFDFKIDQYVYLSSIACYNQESNYGFNKIIGEQIIQRYNKNYLILRLCSIFDEKQNGGILYNIKNNNSVYLDKQSSYNLLPRRILVKIIKELLGSKEDNKIINLGASKSVFLYELERIAKINYAEQKKHIVYEMDTSYIVNLFPFIKTSYEYSEEFLNA